MSDHKLTHRQRDLLQEVGNIGSGHAVTSLSTLLRRRIDMRVPSVNLVTFDEMTDIVGGPEQLVVAMYFRISGEAPGSVYLIFSIDEAEWFVSHLQDKETHLFVDGQPNGEAISILKEVGNIITGSYLTALGDFTDLKLTPSIPYLSIDMAGAILTAGLVEISKVCDEAIVIDTEFGLDQSNIQDISAHLFLLPDPDTSSKLFTEFLGSIQDE